MSDECKRENKILGEIEGKGTRFKTAKKYDKTQYHLVPDPKYCGRTEIAKAELEHRDPSKSGGGRGF